MEGDQRLEERSSPIAVAGLAIIAILAAYFGLFGLLMLDDLILGKVLFHRAPEGFIRLVRVIYAPLIALLRLR